MSIRITSPIKGFSEPSTFGPVTLNFKDGVAEADDLSPTLRSYLETKGYTVEREDEGPFDPGKHTIDEVLEHVNGLDETDVDEYERILAAEKAGKARKGLVEALGQGRESEPQVVVDVSPQGGEQA